MSVLNAKLVQNDAAKCFSDLLAAGNEVEPAMFRRVVRMYSGGCRHLRSNSFLWTLRTVVDGESGVLAELSSKLDERRREYTPFSNGTLGAEAHRQQRLRRLGRAGLRTVQLFEGQYQRRWPGATSPVSAREVKGVNMDCCKRC
jgi:hypothetical protein